MTQTELLKAALKERGVTQRAVAESEQIVRKADIERFGLLSKYVRPYLG